MFSDKNISKTKLISEATLPLGSAANRVFTTPPSPKGLRPLKSPYCHTDWSFLTETLKIYIFYGIA